MEGLINSLRTATHNLVDIVESKLDKCDIPVLRDMSKQLNARPAHVVIGGTSLVILLTIYSLGSNAATRLVGFVYPVYASFRAIKTTSKTDDTAWLTYWVVYACFSVIESLGDLVLAWIPLYTVLKISFLVWCFLPQTKGANIVFTRCIEPFLAKHKSRIEKHISAVNNFASQMNKEVIAPSVKQAANKLSGHAMQAVTEHLQAGANVTSASQTSMSEDRREN